LAFDAQQAQLDRESKERIEMAKLQFQYASKQADMDSAQQPDLQQMLQPLAEQMQTLAQEVAQALQELHGRMEGGKATGIEKLRGPDGRVIGGRIAYADGTTRDVSIQ
jgi:hypothetical protein